MKEEAWIQRLRDQLADHQEAAPDDLWADIEAALARQEEAAPPSPRVVPLWLRWVAAASVAALLAGGGYLLWPPKNDGFIEKVSLAEQVSTPSLAVVGKQEKPPVSERNIERKPVVSSQETTGSPEVTVANEALEEKHPVALSANDDRQEGNPVANVREEPHEDIVSQLDRQIAQLTERHKKRQVALALYAANGFGDQLHTNGVLMSEDMKRNFDYGKYMSVSQKTRSDGDPVYMYNYEERQRHFQPVSFGLTFGYPLTTRLSLSSGLVYTHLRSEFIHQMNTSVMAKRQTLHYIGVPVQAQYLLWRYKGLRTYLSAGGQADYNFKARVETVSMGQSLGKADMDNDRWQWSVNGSAGVEFDFLPMLGFYAEPGVKYYFDNRSKVRNFFKDKQLNFNLQVGLRMSLTQ